MTPLQFDRETGEASMALLRLLHVPPTLRPSLPPRDDYLSTPPSSQLGGQRSPSLPVLPATLHSLMPLTRCHPSLSCTALLSTSPRTCAAVRNLLSAFSLSPATFAPDDVPALLSLPSPSPSAFSVEGIDVICPAPDHIQLAPTSLPRSSPSSLPTPSPGAFRRSSGGPSSGQSEADHLLLPLLPSAREWPRLCHLHQQAMEDIGLEIDGGEMEDDDPCDALSLPSPSLSALLREEWEGELRELPCLLQPSWGGEWEEERGETRVPYRLLVKDWDQPALLSGADDSPQIRQSTWGPAWEDDGLRIPYQPVAEAWDPPEDTLTPLTAPGKRRGTKRGLVPEEPWPFFFDSAKASRPRATSTSIFAGTVPPAQEEGRGGRGEVPGQKQGRRRTRAETRAAAQAKPVARRDKGSHGTRARQRQLTAQTPVATQIK